MRFLFLFFYFLLPLLLRGPANQHRRLLRTEVLVFLHPGPFTSPLALSKGLVCKARPAPLANSYLVAFAKLRKEIFKTSAESLSIRVPTTITTILYYTTIQ